MNKGNSSNWWGRWRVFTKKKRSTRSLVAERAGFQLAPFDQMRLILPDFVQAELIGRLVEVVGKVADDRQYDRAVFLE